MRLASFLPYARLGSAVALLFCLAQAAPQEDVLSAASGVTVRRGASQVALKPGMTVSEDELLTLPEGARLSVRAPGQAPTELTGRYTGTLASWRRNLGSQDTALRSRFLKLLKSEHSLYTPQSVVGVRGNKTADTGAMEWASGDVPPSAADRDRADAQARLLLDAFVAGDLRKVTAEAPRFLAAHASHAQAATLSYTCLLSYFQLGDNAPALKQALEHVTRYSFRREEAALLGYRLALLAGDKRSGDLLPHLVSPEARELAAALRTGASR